MAGKVFPACLGLVGAAAQSSVKREEEEDLAFLSPLTSVWFLWQELLEHWSQASSEYSPFPPHLPSLHQCHAVGVPAERFGGNLLW